MHWKTGVRTKADRFRDLHGSGLFLMPNAWDPGSARMLAAAGFEALATTSAGIAYSLGLPDYAGALTREKMISCVGAIADAVDLPVNADLESGYGDEASDVAKTIESAVSVGIVGGNIEDYSGNPDAPLYDIEHAVERIATARAAADGCGMPFTLTARCDSFLNAVDDPLNEAVRRCNRYREAGADCSFVPGPADAQTIGALVREIDGPLNVVMGLGRETLSADQLRVLGVTRVSIGGSLSRAVFGLIRRAAEEMSGRGTFSYADDQVADDELCRFFAGRTSTSPG